MINYLLLMKPGIVLGNLLTLFAGFTLGSRGEFSITLFLICFLGLGFVMGSACVLNNYFDRHLDAKMVRTQNRALVTGKIAPFYALLLAFLTGILGFSLLLFFTSITSTLLALFGYLLYMSYTFGKSRTPYGTAIGSIAGAIPPVVGYCVLSSLDIGAILLFFTLIFWQMPHFFSIAIYRFEDYKSAKIPVYPLLYGITKAQKRMAIYIILYTISALLLTYFGFTNIFFAYTTLLGSLFWLILCLKPIHNPSSWGRQMFRVSLILIISFSILINY